MNNKTIRILVLDDDDGIRMNLVSYLEYADYNVVAASSGEAALQILERHPIHLTIVDMRLPGMDGNTFIQKAHRIQKEMRFVIFTGSTNYTIPKAIAEIGLEPEHLFYKPLDDMAILIQTIDEIIAAKGLHDIE